VGCSTNMGTSQDKPKRRPERGRPTKIRVRCSSFEKSFGQDEEICEKCSSPPIAVPISPEKSFGRLAHKHEKDGGALEDLEDLGVPEFIKFGDTRVCYWKLFPEDSCLSVAQNSIDITCRVNDCRNVASFCCVNDGGEWRCEEHIFVEEKFKLDDTCPVATRLTYVTYHMMVNVRGGVDGFGSKNIARHLVELLKQILSQQFYINIEEGYRPSLLKLYETNPDELDLCREAVTLVVG